MNKIKIAPKDIGEQIKEWQKDPEFIRAAYEFIRYHTGHRVTPSKRKDLN